MVAVAHEGIVATEVHLGAFNANLFVDFLTNSLIPALDAPHTIVMDNDPFHKNAQVGEALEEAGHTVLRLPPYTPHLKATEYVFGNVKPYIQLQDFADQETLIEHINNGLNEISPDKCFGWIREVNRNQCQILERQPLGCLYT
jgi:transposase